MLAFLNTPTFPVFSPPTYFNPAFILRFYLSFIFYLAFIYCVLLFTNIIYHVMRTDTCNKPHTLRDAVTGRNRNRNIYVGFIYSYVGISSCTRGKFEKRPDKRVLIIPNHVCF